MTGVPAPTLYHRWLGWHAPAMRRALTAFLAGLIVAVVLLPFVTWGLALVGGWDAAALTVLLTVWPIIIRADSSLAPQLAAREDETEGSARALLVGTSAASLVGAGYALHLAGRDSGAPRVLLIGFAVLTVVLSWTVINTIYTLRYADQNFRSKPGGIAFGAEDDQQRGMFLAARRSSAWPVRLWPGRAMTGASRTALWAPEYSQHASNRKAARSSRCWCDN